MEGVTPKKIMNGGRLPFNPIDLIDPKARSSKASNRGPTKHAGRLLDGDQNDDDAYVSSYLTDQAGNAVDPYSVAWRYLGMYVDCDIQQEDGGYGDDANNDGDGNCERVLLWAAYYDPEYEGGGMNEYKFYDIDSEKWDASGCGKGRCARMDCHEPNTQFQLVGVYKQYDGLGDWAYQLFLHEGSCIWDSDTTEVMKMTRQRLANECQQLALPDADGNALYLDILPKSQGDIAMGVFLDDKCSQLSSMTYGEYLTMYYVYYYYDEDRGRAQAQYWDAYFKIWNNNMNQYKVCQPCKAYDLHKSSDKGKSYYVAEDEDGRLLRSKSKDLSCEDSYGYTDANQCYIFETLTEMQQADSSDLALASGQGSILEIAVGNEIYGSGGYRSAPEATVFFRRVLWIAGLALLFTFLYRCYRKVFRRWRGALPDSFRESLYDKGGSDSGASPVYDGKRNRKGLKFFGRTEKDLRDELKTQASDIEGVDSYLAEPIEHTYSTSLRARSEDSPDDQSSAESLAFLGDAIWKSLSPTNLMRNLSKQGTTEGTFNEDSRYAQSVAGRSSFGDTNTFDESEMASYVTGPDPKDILSNQSDESLSVGDTNKEKRKFTFEDKDVNKNEQSETPEIAPDQITSDQVRQMMAKIQFLEAQLAQKSSGFTAFPTGGDDFFGRQLRELESSLNMLKGAMGIKTPTFGADPAPTEQPSAADESALTVKTEGAPGDSKPESSVSDKPAEDEEAARVDIDVESVISSGSASSLNTYHKKVQAILAAAAKEPVPEIERVSSTVGYQHELMATIEAAEKEVTEVNLPAQYEVPTFSMPASWCEELKKVKDTLADFEKGAAKTNWAVKKKESYSDAYTQKVTAVVAAPKVEVPTTVKSVSSLGSGTCLSELEVDGEAASKEIATGASAELDTIDEPPAAAHEAVDGTEGPEVTDEQSGGLAAIVTTAESGEADTPRPLSPVQAAQEKLWDSDGALKESKEQQEEEGKRQENSPPVLPELGHSEAATTEEAEDTPEEPEPKIAEELEPEKETGMHLEKLKAFIADGGAPPISNTTEADGAPPISSTTDAVTDESV